MHVVGLASMTVPIYLAECAPTHLRGGLTVADNMAITGGQFVAGIVDFSFSYTAHGWRSAQSVQLCVRVFLQIQTKTQREYRTT